jgi:Family of unknown function (DUF5654)
MSDQSDDQNTDQQGSSEAERRGVPIVGAVVDTTTVVVRKTTRFSREVVATMISLASAAFGLVAALAWNGAITTWFSNIYPNENTRVGPLFIYAAIVTIIGVTVIVLLGRLATRINAQPVEFKYPATPKPQ